MNLICSFQIPGEPTGKGRPRMTTRGGKVRFGIDILCRFHMLRKSKIASPAKKQPCRASCLMAICQSGLAMRSAAGLFR